LLHLVEHATRRVNRVPCAGGPVVSATQSTEKPGQNHLLSRSTRRPTRR
jgi:hypothetical protein